MGLIVKTIFFQSYASPELNEWELPQQHNYDDRQYYYALFIDFSMTWFLIVYVNAGKKLPKLRFHRHENR